MDNDRDQVRPSDTTSLPVRALVEVRAHSGAEKAGEAGAAGWNVNRAGRFNGHRTGDSQDHISIVSLRGDAPFRRLFSM